MIDIGDTNSPTRAEIGMEVSNISQVTSNPKVKLTLQLGQKGMDWRSLTYHKLHQNPKVKFTNAQE